LLRAVWVPKRFRGVVISVAGHEISDHLLVLVDKNVNHYTTKALFPSLIKHTFFTEINQFSKSVFFKHLRTSEKTAISETKNCKFCNVLSETYISITLISVTYISIAPISVNVRFYSSHFSNVHFYNFHFSNVHSYSSHFSIRTFL